MSLSAPEVELEGSKNLPFLKYYNAEEWESVFTLGNTAKDTDYTKKKFKQRLHRIEFPIKNSMETSISNPWVELGGFKDLVL